MWICGNDQLKIPNTEPIAPKTTPNTPATIPIHAPNKPVTNPNNPPKIPIQIGKVKIINRIIRNVELERVMDIFSLVSPPSQKSFHS